MSIKSYRKKKSFKANSHLCVSLKKKKKKNMEEGNVHHAARSLQLSKEEDYFQLRERPQKN